jgi:hypothetical protein
MGEYPLDVRFQWSFANEGDTHPVYNIENQKEDQALSR